MRQADTTNSRPLSGVLDALRPRRAGVVYALILIALAFEVLSKAKGLPPFLEISNIQNIFNAAAIDGILVVSMTVLLITGNFDLSVGATAGLAGAVGLSVANADGQLLGIIAALGVGLGVGLTNGFLVEIVGVNAFIVTLGTYTALQGLLLTITSGNTILAKSGQYGWIGQGTWTVPRVALIVVGVLLVVGAVLWWRAGSRAARLGAGHGNAIATGATGVGLLVVGIFFSGLATQSRDAWLMLAYMVVMALILRFTVLGRRVYAVGGNREAARLSGIGVRRYRMGAFVLTSMSAGVAGIVYAGQFAAVDPSALVNEELPVLAAAILGGTSLFGGSGYILKSVVGTLILTSLTVGFNILNLGSNSQYLVQGAVIIGAAAVYTVGGRERGRRSKSRSEASTSAPAPPPSESSPSPITERTGVA